MFRFIKDMLSERSDVSSMRVMCFVSLFSGVGIACYGISHHQDLSSLAILCGVFVSAAFSGKAVQKVYELKDPSRSKDN